MTRKDYEKFAEMFRTFTIEGHTNIGPYACPETMKLCKQTADIFFRNNVRFDPVRYLKACGVRTEDI